MSLSEPKLTNPVTKFITFKSEKNKFVYWDKEQEKNIEVQMPIYFIILDELTTIRGYHKASESGIYSNEIKYLGDEILNVKSFKGSLNIVGKYSNIKDSIKANGGKYAKSIYAALITGKNSIEMVNFNFSGSSVSEWIEQLNRPSIMVVDGPCNGLSPAATVWRGGWKPRASRWICFDTTSWERRIMRVLSC